MSGNRLAQRLITGYSDASLSRGMPGLAVLTSVGGRLPGGPPVPLLPPLDELVLPVVQAADAGAVLVGGGGVQHGDMGSPPACNGAAVSLGAVLPSPHPCPGAALPSPHPCLKARSGARAGSLLSITPTTSPTVDGDLEGPSKWSHRVTLWCWGGSITAVPVQLRPALATLTRQREVSPCSSSFSLSLQGRAPPPHHFPWGHLPGQKGPSHSCRGGGEGQLGDRERGETACPLASAAALEARVLLPLLQGAGAGGQALAPCPRTLLLSRPRQALQPVVDAHTALQLVNPHPAEV